MLSSTVVWVATLMDDSLGTVLSDEC
jgi:hypothetical protein